MVRSPFPGWSAIQWPDIAAGAQTERRGGAGPAGACLAVRTPPAALFCPFRCSWAALCSNGPVSLPGRRRLAVVQRGDVEGSRLTPLGPGAVDQGPHPPAPAQATARREDIRFDFMPVRR